MLERPLLTACVAYTTHFVATKLYSNFCIPDGVWGFLQGSLTTASPICSTVLNTMSATQITYGALMTYTLSQLFVESFLPWGKHKDNQIQQPETTNA